MITRSSILHVRLPFSYLLLPIYLMALLTADSFDHAKAWAVFFVLHFLLYPAANGFNSFYDRDEESIGALKRPPTVTNDLLWFSLALDTAALIIAACVGWRFVAGCLIYSLAAKAYSWDKIRIKRFPFLGWLFAGCGQGTLTLLVVLSSVQGFSHSAFAAPRVLLPAAVASLFSLGMLPLMQVYQHREDSKRGCETISLRLGVRGTFYLSFFFMATAALVYYLYLCSHLGKGPALLFLACNIPAAVYFVGWFLAVRKDETSADFSHAMRMCIVAATGLNLFLLGALLVAGGKVTTVAGI